MLSISKEQWQGMTKTQRALHLISKGVTAQLQIDPKALAPGFAAFADGVSLPVGYHDSEAEAIAAGSAWLNDILVKEKPATADGS